MKSSVEVVVEVEVDVGVMVEYCSLWVEVVDVEEEREQGGGLGELRRWD